MENKKTTEELQEQYCRQKSIFLPSATLIIVFCICCQLNMCRNWKQEEIEAYTKDCQSREESRIRQEESNKAFAIRNQEIYEAKKLKDSLDNELLKAQIEYYKQNKK